eukprot:GHVN01037404.1.p1 GENE.GHVN01037404.1~~GHVN01037404.1.p1  ORF type:complete len:281 (+),score=58.63 GHVN01037404.1:458-1300(+)
MIVAPDTNVKKMMEKEKAPCRPYVEAFSVGSEIDCIEIEVYAKWRGEFICLILSSEEFMSFSVSDLCDKIQSVTKIPTEKQKLLSVTNGSNRPPTATDFLLDLNFKLKPPQPRTPSPVKPPRSTDSSPSTSSPSSGPSQPSPNRSAPYPVSPTVPSFSLADKSRGLWAATRRHDSPGEGYGSNKSVGMVAFMLVGTPEDQHIPWGNGVRTGMKISNYTDDVDITDLVINDLRDPLKKEWASSLNDDDKSPASVRTPINLHRLSLTAENTNVHLVNPPRAG